MFDEGYEVFGVSLYRIFTILGCLTFSETHVVGYYDAVAFCQRWDEIPVKIALGRFPVQTDDRITLAFVDIVHTEPCPMEKLGFEGPSLIESFVSQYHTALPL